MTDIFYRAVSRLGYLMRKKGLHDLHSPFVYDFASNVIFDKKSYAAYEVLMRARRIMLHNRNLIETVDFGSEAGESEFKTYRIRINKLAKKRIGPKKDVALLFRIAQYYRPEHILEFGTSTGLSSLAIALSHPKASLTTMEGCASVASVAQSVFDRMDAKNIHIEIGNFNHILPDVLSKMPSLDMVFFDGNHRKLPTINYFHHCLTKAHPGSIFVFDDIRWSAEMYEAWEEIANSKEVSVSIELSRMGIVFFRQGIEKQHFVLG
ncbi:MAG: class I SAM-dependent methyltransferase [Bacteroidia bacterium]|nr:class I SAM-dependent methyltransferase [Bacteroidia bacterium]